MNDNKFHYLASELKELRRRAGCLSNIQAQVNLSLIMGFIDKSNNYKASCLVMLIYKCFDTAKEADLLLMCYGLLKGYDNFDTVKERRYLYYDNFLSFEGLKDWNNTIRKREDKLIEQFAKYIYNLNLANQLTKILNQAPKELLLPLPRYHEIASLVDEHSKIVNSTNAELLAQSLNENPIAIDLANAFIKEQNISYENYIEIIEQHKKNLYNEKNSSDRERIIIQSVYNITLEKLNIEATRLLYCFAYMSADDIRLDQLTKYAKIVKKKQEEPDLLFVQHTKKVLPKVINVSKIFSDFEKFKFNPNLVPILTDDVVLKKTLSELKKYSLIRAKYDNAFEMPTLLQEVIRQSITDISYSSSVAAIHEL